MGYAVAVHREAAGGFDFGGVGRAAHDGGGIADGAGGVHEAIGRFGPVAPGPQRREGGGRLARGGEKVVHEGVGFEGEDARRRLNRNHGEIAQEEGQGRQQAFPRGAALGRDEQPCRGRFAYHTFPAPGV